MTYASFLKKLLSASVLTLAAIRHGVAQQDHSASLGVNYTYLRTNVLPGCNCVNMNGGGADLEVQLGPHLSVLGDINGTHASGITPDGYTLTQLTYTAGVRYRPKLHLPMRPFGEVLLGGAHTSGSLSPDHTGFGGANAFAFQTGGGVDLRVTRNWTLVPARADYLLTTFSNGAADHQNDLRISAGLSYRFRP